MNKLNIKTVFVVILVIILGVGIYLLFQSSKNSSGGVSQEDKGFFSFFGDRKTKPLDETTVPGAKPGSNNNGDVNNSSNNPNNPNNNGGESGSGTQGSNTQGSLSIKSIGNQGGSSTGSNSGGSSGTNSNLPNSNSGNNPNNPNGSNPTNGGVIVCPDNNPNCNLPPIETIDCTPPKLPYTDTQIAELKTLVARFYNIAAGLKTQSDIQNEIDTRQSYIELINQANSYTNQCLAEIKAEKAKPTGKAIDNNPRWHPYLSVNFVSKLPASNDAINELNLQLEVYKFQVNKIIQEKNFLESLGTSRNENQNALLVKLNEDYKQAVKNRDNTSQKINDLKSGKLSSLKLLKGTFFPEVKNSYFADNLTPKRLNDDWDRRNRIYEMISQRIWDTSNFWKTDSNSSQPFAIFYFFQDTPETREANPLYWLRSDIPNNTDGQNPGASGVKNFHRLQQLEDALGIW